MIAGPALAELRDLAAGRHRAHLEHRPGFLQISRRPIKKVPSLRAAHPTMFYEASTPPRVSFELAAKRLSADTVNISASLLGLQGRVACLDTVQTLNRHARLPTPW